MIRTLLATTAVASMIATGAFAQNAQTQNAPAASPNSNQSQQANPPGMKPADEVKASKATQEGGHLASQIMGKAVYNGEGQNAKNIGDVNDMVIGKDGKVASVIVGVGGFLGMGEKNVAIAYNQLQWKQQKGEWTIVVPTTTDQLKTLPDFNRKAYQAGPVAGTGMAANNAKSAAGGMTAATAMAPSAGTTNGSAPDTTTKTAAIDKNSLKKVDVSTISANDLIGTTVYGANNADLGSIDDVVLNKGGKIDAIVIDVGGFLGMGSKKVAVGMDNLQFMADKNGKKYLYTPLTKDQLQKQPTYDKATYAANRDKMRMTVQ